DTGQGPNELYDMNQNVQTSDTVNFLKLGVNQPTPGYPIHLIDDNATAVVNTDSNDGASYWTGLRVARQGSEKWFIGVDNTTDSLLFRRAGTTNDVTISTAGALSGNGSNLTSLNASNISSGTLTDARLSASVSLLGQTIGSTEIQDGDIVFGDWASNSCGSGQIPKWNGSAWACANDDAGASEADTLQTVTDRGAITTQPITVATVNTGQGAYELYAMNQNVQTSDTVNFLNVGIGTPSPNTKLTVYNSGGGIADLETSDASVVFGDVLGELQFRGLDASVTHQIGALIRAEADNTWGGIANDAPTRLAFYTQSDGSGDGLIGPQLTIRSSGYIGIGTASPGDNLHVYTSTTQTTPQIYIEQDSTGDAAIELGIVGDSYIVGIDNSDSDKFKISYSATQGSAVLGTTDRLVIDASGNVTIGGTITSTAGFSGPGGSLTGLNASNLSSGTIPLARLSGITTTQLSASAGLVAGQISPDIVSSVDGVANDGGNIDLVAGSGITLAPDDAANTITISAAGGGSDIQVGNCGNTDSGTATCTASCPAGYEIVHSAITCEYNGYYTGEGGDPNSGWACGKLIGTIAPGTSTDMTFRARRSSGNVGVYGSVWCIQN
ncbi:MAG: hypothetical protein AAB671_00155, partial [Patescibacteria group bacterium]